MNNINFAKTARSIFVLVTIGILSIALIACREDSGLPKPIGKKVTLSVAQLNGRLNQLNFSLDSDAILMTEMDHVFSSGQKDNLRTSTGTSKSTYNYANQDMWSRGQSKITFEDSVYEANIQGFENATAVYIDIKDTLNQPFSEPYDYMSDHIDGKYELLKQLWISWNQGLGAIYLDLGIEMILSNHFQVESHILDLVRDLHQHNFKGLAFYQQASNFSITLDIKVIDYNEYSSEIIEIIKEYYSIEKSYQEYLDTRIVMNFTDNKLVEFGQVIKTGYEIEDAYFMQGEAKLYQRLMDHLPTEFIYEDYESIDSLEDIKS